MEMRKHMRLFPLFLVAIVALIVGAAAPEAWVQEKVPLDEARIFIEYNSSDNDLGFHVFLDEKTGRRLRSLTRTGARSSRSRDVEVSENSALPSSSLRARSRRSSTSRSGNF
jgi:hypothetical protein